MRKDAIKAFCDAIPSSDWKSLRQEGYRVEKCVISPLATPMTARAEKDPPYDGGSL